MKTQKPIYFPEPILKAIEKLAAEQDRSFTYITIKILEVGLESFLIKSESQEPHSPDKL